MWIFPIELRAVVDGRSCREAGAVLVVFLLAGTCNIGTPVGGV